ncbi:MAG: AMP-binding protein, partial [Dokdonella sp.]
MSAAVNSTSPAGAQPLAIGPDDRNLAFESGQSHSLDRFLGQVRGVAEALPPGHHAVNLCDDRYRFLVAFCAVALRGQVTLLPTSRAPLVIADVLDEYADSYTLGDGPLSPQPPRYWQMPQVLPELDGPLPTILDDAVVAIGFTSGSTGSPTANVKTWASFRTSTAQNLAALHDLWPADALPSVVATVPPQHMYGMELSVVLPLIGPAAVHSARPFFHADVACVLDEIPEPRLLVTTPVHLRK